MFLLEYDLVPDYIERRAEFREAHLALATKAAQRGELVLGGALADRPDRALLIWRVTGRRVRPRRSLCHKRVGALMVDPTLERRGRHGILTD